MMPHDKEAFFRGVYAMSEPFKRWDVACDRMRVTRASVTVTRPNRHYLPEGAKIHIDGRRFTVRSFSGAQALRVVSEFEFRQGRVTRASVNKRNRHAKRPGGRR